MLHSIRRLITKFQCNQVVMVAGTASLAAVATWHAMADGTDHAPPMESCRVTVADHSDLYPVAITKDQQQRGLSGREDIGKGMLFVWREPTTPAVWMKDTHVALSVAFIDPTGRISAIEMMAPETLDYHVPPGPILAMLERGKGQFRKDDISVGDHVQAECLTFNAEPRPIAPGME